MVRLIHASFLPFTAMYLAQVSNNVGPNVAGGNSGRLTLFMHQCKIKVRACVRWCVQRSEMSRDGNNFFMLLTGQ